MSDFFSLVKRWFAFGAMMDDSAMPVPGLVTDTGEDLKKDCEMCAKKNVVRRTLDHFRKAGCISNELWCESALAYLSVEIASDHPSDEADPDNNCNRAECRPARYKSLVWHLFEDYFELRQQCEVCQQVFTSKDNLSDHFFEKHVLGVWLAHLERVRKDENVAVLNASNRGVHELLDPLDESQTESFKLEDPLDCEAQGVAGEPQGGGVPIQAGEEIVTKEEETMTEEMNEQGKQADAAFVGPAVETPKAESSPGSVFESAIDPLQLSIDTSMDDRDYTALESLLDDEDIEFDLYDLFCFSEFALYDPDGAGCQDVPKDEATIGLQEDKSLEIRDPQALLAGPSLIPVQKQENAQPEPAGENKRKKRKKRRTGR